MKTNFSIQVILRITIISIVVFPMFLVGQVNTEKFRKHDLDEGFIFNTNFRFGYSGGNSEYVSVDGTFRVDYNGEKSDLFLVANYNYKATNTERVVNKGFVHLRGIRNISSNFALEAFLQQEFNEFLKLEDRKLAGASGRFLLINATSKKDSISGFRSFIGIGGMYEHEVYDLQSGELLNEKSNLFRLTSYLTTDWNISDRINLWAVGYYQPALTRFSNYKLVVESGMEILVIGKLFFTIDMSYRYNNEPVGDVKNYDIVINNGLRFTFP